ncbi:MAG: CofH family radical SAM protein [Spirochaetota bacterium]
MNNSLKQKIYDNERITPEEAAGLFAWDILELGMAADYRRRVIFPKEDVGFIIDRIINYSNICEAKCSFCAFHAKAGRMDPYELTLEDILRKAEELASAGGTQIMLQGGLHPDYTLDRYSQILRTVKTRFPNIKLHSFSPSELLHISKKAGLSVDEVLSALQEAGLDSVPGASDLLVDNVRQRVCPNKISTRDWQGVMQALKKHGMMSSATMTYGMGETLADRVEHLRVVRDVQDSTGIIRAFIPWSFSPAHTQMEDIVPATGMDYLKVVAVSRIFLDNVVYIQAGWLTEGLKLAQVALAMGANDMGGVLTEEVVVKSTGIETRSSKQEFIDIITNAGKVPVERNSAYEAVKYY